MPYPIGSLAVRLAALAAISLAPLGSVKAQPGVSLEERLQRLEATVESLRRENAELRQLRGTAAPTPHASLLPGGSETRLVVGGLIHMQAEFGGAADARFAGVNDRLYLRRARLYLAGNFARNIDFKIEGDFCANSYVPGTGLRAQANEIFVNWNRFPEACVRIGQLKPAFGGEQLASDLKLPVIERYLASDRLADGRQLAMSLTGDFLNKRLSYLVVAGNGTGMNTSANDNSKFQTSARLSAVALDDARGGRLSFGINGLHSDDNGVGKAGLGFDSVPGGIVDNLFVGHRQGWAVDADWRKGTVALSCEFIRQRFQPFNALPARSFNGEGWHITAVASFMSDTLQAVLRCEAFDPNTLVAGDTTQNWVLGINYLIKGDDLKLMADYIFGHAPGLMGDQGRVHTRLQILY